MTNKDAIIAAITGFCVAFIFSDFLQATKFSAFAWHLFWLFPVLSVVCLEVANQIGKKITFIDEAAKFFLVGAFSAVVDIKVYQIAALLLAFATGNSIISKAISFLVATAVKYGGNKIWVFKKHGRDGIKKEIAQFLTITAIGMAIDVSIFYCLSRQSPWASADATHLQIWTEISIIIAALVAALWNFLGYKFWVFKK